MILQKLDLISKTHQIYFIRVREFIGNLVSLIFLTSKYSPSNFHPCLAEESEKRETRSKRREGGIGRIKEESLIASRGKKMISSKNSPRTVVSSRVHACACVSRHDRTWSGNAASRASKTRCVALL